MDVNHRVIMLDFIGEYFIPPVAQFVFVGAKISSEI